MKKVGQYFGRRPKHLKYSAALEKATKSSLIFIRGIFVNNGILWAVVVPLVTFLTIFIVKKHYVYSFFRYVFMNKNILWLLVIPLTVYIIVLAVLLLTISKNNALLQNMVTTCIGILFTVTIVTFAINKENDKIYLNFKSRIYEQIESKCCEYIWYTLNDYLGPGTGLEEQIYKFFPDPHPLVWEIPRKAINNEKSLMEFVDKLFTIANKSDAVDYLRNKKSLKEELSSVLLNQRSFLTVDVIENLEQICLNDSLEGHYGGGFPSRDPGGDMRHKGEWKSHLFDDIEQTFKVCIRLFKGVNRWRKDNIQDPPLG